jgi:hypothetical protein
MEVFDLLYGQAIVIVGKKKTLFGNKRKEKTFSLMYQSNYITNFYFLFLSKTAALRVLFDFCEGRVKLRCT